MLERLGRARQTNRRSVALVIGALVPLALLLIGCVEATAPGAADPGRQEPPGLFPIAPVNQNGQYVFDFYPVIFWIAVAVFVLVEGLLLWIVLRYRRKPSDDVLPPQTHGNNLLEIVWTAIPALVVMGLFAFTIDMLGKMEDTSAVEQRAVTIDVTAFQWQWTFEYPDQGVTLRGSGRTGPVMAVPVNETIHLRLHAADSDVIHSFYVPQFLYKEDIVPGRVNEFDVVVNQPGIYAGQCAEFCGLGHANMLFTVQAMSRAEFDAWVAQAQQQPTPNPNQPTPAPGGATIEVTSISIAEGFDPSELTAPADALFTVQLTNADPAVPHDFAIRNVDGAGTDWQGDPDAEGGGSATYNPPQLAAGDYEFYCSIHPNMVGTLRVGQ